MNATGASSSESAAREIRELIETMQAAVAAAPAIYRPGEFWDGLVASNLDMLESAGVANFKRTISNNYFNWTVTTLRDPQVKQAVVAWLRHPSLAPCRNRVQRPLSGLRTLDRDGAFALSRRATLLYKFFVGQAWETARRGDLFGLTDHLAEPQLGNPVRIERRGRLISQDLANSIIEFTFVARSGAIAEGARVAELGAGYGRLAYVFAQARRVVYCIFDIPPALAVAQWYLGSVLGLDRIVPYAPQHDFAALESRLVPGAVAFFTPDQLELFPDRWFDCTQTISTLPEMPARQSAHYRDLLAAKSRRAIFLKQWLTWLNPADRVELSEQHYTFPAPWHLAARRVDPIQPAFFNQLWFRPQDDAAASSAVSKERANDAQESSRARAMPRSRSSAQRAGERRSRSSAAVMLAVSRGSAYSAASPPTSGSEDTFDVITGAPAAMASSTGSPNPSPKEG
jgi:putative sugar O-methyltransferase